MIRLSPLLASFALLFTAAIAHADNSELENRLIAAFEAGELEGLHSVLIQQHGEPLVEVYFSGEDERWGTPLDVRDHGPDTLHDLRSVTKSIVGLLYGIALADGIVPDPSASLLSSFPEYADLVGDPVRDSIRIADALTMQMGTEWDESLPYSNPANSEIAMELAPDRYRYVLNRPMVSPPGTEYTYNGGATAIIAHLIARGAEMPIDAYAREKLFAPLGISEFEWVRGGDGEPSAASGLRLSSRNLARIGQMILNGGEFDGRQIVPESWIRASFTPHAESGFLRYGYFWWLSPQGNPPHWAAGLGNGGQRLSINRNLGLVLVIQAGNYNQPDAWELPVKVITDFLVPALEGE